MDYNEELQKASDKYYEDNKGDLDPFRQEEYEEAFKAGARWQDEYIRKRLIEQAPFCLIPSETAEGRSQMVTNMPPDLMNKILDWAAEEAIKGMREAEKPQE